MPDPTPDARTDKPAGAPVPGGKPTDLEKLGWSRDTGVAPAPVRRWRFRGPRREHMLDALACLTLSALWFSHASSETLSFAHRGFYQRIPLGAPALLALAVNIVALAMVAFLAVQGLRRLRQPAWRRLAAAVAAVALLVALNFARMGHELVGQWADALGRPVLLVLVALLPIVSLRWPGPAFRAMRAVVLAVSPVGVITVTYALWMILEVTANPMWTRPPPAPREEPAPSLRRVVWLVFEELDQRVVFEARPPGVELPELDRLRRESLHAGAARPPAGTTELSLPALLTGRPVVAASPVSPNELQLTFADGKTALWSAHPTVFVRARALGYDTAVVGWHLPYPRVLGSSLGRADWRPSVAAEQARGDTFRQSVVNQWGSLVPPLNARRLLSERVAELRDLAIRTAADGRFGLVLLHLPLPRPPGIYDRDTGRLTPWNFTGPSGGYVDNLAFTDRMIGDLRRGLDRVRLTDRTWIIISSSHWWRGSAQYDGQVDQRVPFLVRPPDGGRGRHVDAPLNTLGTHELVLGILRGSIRDTDDAVAWLARQTIAPPRDYTSDGRPIQ